MIRLKRLYVASCVIVSIMCFSFIILEPEISLDDGFLRSSGQLISKYVDKISALQHAANSDQREDDFYDMFDEIIHANKPTKKVDSGSLDLSLSRMKRLQGLELTIYDNDSNISSNEDEYLSFGSTEQSISSPDLDEYDSESRCKPQENVVFLKTHKTGSSTITNILNRYADLRELRVALPVTGFYRFRWPLKFNWAAVDLWRLNGETANVLCNHARYHRPALNVIMKNNTKYITILRNPVDQWESTFNYMEFSSFLNLSNDETPMETFLTNPHRYLRRMAARLKTFPESMNLIRNGMFFDLGMPPRLYEDINAIKREIEKIDGDFSLVLIMEYFDESLVLLKREFCWDLDDILYVRFNQRQKRNETNRLSEQLIQNIRAWNAADVLLYEYFNHTFWEKIKSHGAAFYKDLKDFRIKNAKMQQQCVANEEATELAFQLSGRIKSFQLNPSVDQYNRYFCQKMLTNEIHYINYFRYKFIPYKGYQKQLIAEGNFRASASSKELYWRLQNFRQIQFNRAQRMRTH